MTGSCAVLVIGQVGVWVVPWHRGPAAWLLLHSLWLQMCDQCEMVHHILDVFYTLAGAGDTGSIFIYVCLA